MVRAITHIYVARRNVPKCAPYARYHCNAQRVIAARFEHKCVSTPKRARHREEQRQIDGDRMTGERTIYTHTNELESEIQQESIGEISIEAMIAE